MGSDGTRDERVRGRVEDRGSGIETGETARRRVLKGWLEGWLTILGEASRRVGLSPSEVNELTERI
jgi:hypothetical protein